MTIRLLIVDDSAFMRKIISDMASEMDDVEVVGTARDGIDALDSIERLKPDIVTLDVEMPRLNGIETLKEIKKKYSTPVIMVSSNNEASTTIEALQIGALDFIEKPGNLLSELEELKIELEKKIKSVSYCKTVYQKPKETKSIISSDLYKKDIKAVVIAASTGGPKALVYIISKLPKKISVPIFIVQHMAKDFITSFASRLDRESGIKVVEAKDNTIIQRNTIYISPGDYHMTVRNRRIRLNQEEKLHGVRPAADYLFESVAELYGENTLGIILTGMGRDGTRGIEKLKNTGGFSIAQSEKTCVVYGMPGSAVKRGVIHEIMDLEDISKALNKSIEVK